MLPEARQKQKSRPKPGVLSTSDLEAEVGIELACADLQSGMNLSDLAACAPIPAPQSPEG